MTVIDSNKTLLAQRAVMYLIKHVWDAECLQLLGPVMAGYRPRPGP